MSLVFGIMSVTWIVMILWTWSERLQRQTSVDCSHSHLSHSHLYASACDFLSCENALSKPKHLFISCKYLLPLFAYGNHLHHIPHIFLFHIWYITAFSRTFHVITLLHACASGKVMFNVHFLVRRNAFLQLYRLVVKSWYDLKLECCDVVLCALNVG
jgi:hypothetical protein